MPTLETPLKTDSSDKSDQEAINLDLSLTSKNPLYPIRSNYLSIKVKKGEMIRLKLNTCQKKLFNTIIKYRKEKKPIRIWLLKFRQGGFSTEIEAIIYLLTSQQENRNSLIMADEADHSDNLFEMSKLYQEQLEINEPHLAPDLKKSNAKELVWEGIHSKIIIDSSKNIQAARSYTYQYVHLSETAFFRNLKAVLDALNQTVPDWWDTLIIGETTANGMNEFHTEWIRAIEGKTDWIPLFFAWFEMEEYTLPLINGELYPLKGINFDADTSIAAFEKEEYDLIREHKLTQGQLNWRRWAITNKCQGDISRFRTEYPATWQEAFSMSGSLFFDRKGLMKQKEQRPVAIGEIFYQDMKYEFRDLEHGKVSIFEKPIEGEQYIVTLDASEAVDKDEAAALVLNKRTNVTAAIVAGQYTPEELAQIGIGLGNYYNTALIAPESKGYGYMVCQLVNKKYGNVYRRVTTKTGENKPTEEIGFNTNSVTRPQMIAQMNEEIKNKTTDLNSKELLNECQTFVIKKDKQGKVTKIEAQDGKQDGLVMCRAIAGYIRNERPYLAPRIGDAAKRRSIRARLASKKNAGIGFKKG